MKKHIFNMQGYFKRAIAGVVVASNVFSYLPTNVNAETDIEQSLETDTVKEDSSNLDGDTSIDKVDEVLVEEIENSLPEDEIIIDKEIDEVEETTTSDTDIIEETDIIEIEDSTISNNQDNNINDTDFIENIDNTDNTDSIENIESEEESSIEVEDITIDDYIIKNQNNDTTTDFNFNDTLKVEVLDTNNSDGISLYLNDELVDTITSINSSTNTLEVNLKELTHLTEGSYEVKVTRNSNNIDTDSIELGNIKISAIPVKMHLDVSKVYDGLNTIQVTDQQLVDANTDLPISDITFNATITTDSSNVGTYDFNNISTNDAVIVGTNANQYTIENYTFNDTSQVEITKKEITPSITVVDKIYDGTTDANVNVTFNNLEGSDSFLLNTDYTVSASYDNSDVGESIPVTATIRLENTTLANNYSLQTSTVKATGNIIKSNSQIVDVKIYDGSTASTYFDFNDTITVKAIPKLSKIDSINDNINKAELYINDILVDTQDASINNELVFNYKLSNLTELSEGTYPVKIVYKGNDNVNSVTVGAGNIFIAAIRIKIRANASKIYDGTREIIAYDQELIQNVTETLITDATADLTIVAPNSTASNHSYSYDDLYYKNLTFKGPGRNHYIFDRYHYYFTSDSYVEIMRKEITFDVELKDKIYDETTKATVNNINLNGLIGDDTLVLGKDYFVSANFDTPDAGEDKDVEVKLTFSKDSSRLGTNYTAKPITIKSSIAKRDIYAGASIKNYVTGDFATSFNFNSTISVNVWVDYESLPKSNQNSVPVSVYIDDILIGTESIPIDWNHIFVYDLKNLTTLSAGKHKVRIVCEEDLNTNYFEGSRDITINEVNIYPVIDNVVKKYYDGTNIFKGLTTTKFKYYANDKYVEEEEGLSLEFDAITDYKDATYYNGYTKSVSYTMSNVNFNAKRLNHFKIIDIKNISRPPVGSYIPTLIEPKLITISPESRVMIADKVYDKMPQATLIEADIKFDGLVQGEEFIRDVDYNLHPYFQDIYAGVDKVAFAGVGLISDKTRNYRINGNAAVYTTATIHKLPFDSINNYKISNYYNKETRDFDFNDTIIVQISKDDITRNIDAIPEKKFQLYVNDIPVKTETEMVVEYNHSYRLRATLDSLVELSEGTYPLKAKYGGDMNTTEGEIDLGTINISAIEVIPYSFSYNDTPTKVYDGNTLFKDVVTYSLYKVATPNSPNYYGSSSYGSGSNIEYRWSTSNSPKVGAVVTFDMNAPSKNVNYYSGYNSDITISNWRIEGERSKHYKLANLPADKMDQYISMNIIRKDAILEAIVEDKVYDGTPETILTDLVIKGGIEGDEIVNGVDYNPVVVKFENSDVGSNKKVIVGLQYLWPTDTVLNNYNISNMDTVETYANIIKADSQITNSNILDTTDTPKTEFDFLDTIRITGTPVIKTSQANKANIYFDDELIDSVDCDINNTFTKDIVIEDYPNITAGTHNVKVVWTGDDNHSLSETDYGRIHVIGTPIKAEVSQDIEYNGGNTFEIQTTTVKDKNTDNHILLTVTATVTVDNVNVGTANIISASDITISDNNSNRYEILPEDITGTINIVKKPIKPISVTVKEENNKFEVTDIEFEGNIEDLELGKDFIVTIEKIDGSNDVIVKVELGNTIVSNNYELSVPTIQTTPVKVPTNNNNRPHRPSGGGGSSNSSTEEPSIEEEEIEPVEEETPIKKPPFKDINGHWSQEAIEHLTELGIIVGYPDNTFRPDEKIIRGDTAIVKEKTISHLGHNLETDNHPTFTDVHKEQYYYEAIKNVVNQDIFVGYLDNSFRPENVITREESFVIMSKFIDQYCEGLKLTDNPMVYKDYDLVANWAKPYLDNLNKFGIIKGDTNGYVNPKSEVTRAEISQMLYNIIKQN